MACDGAHFMVTEASILELSDHTGSNTVVCVVRGSLPSQTTKASSEKESCVLAEHCKTMDHWTGVQQGELSGKLSLETGEIMQALHWPHLNVVSDYAACLLFAQLDATGC